MFPRRFASSTCRPATRCRDRFVRRKKGALLRADQGRGRQLRGADRPATSCSSKT
jgi:hypothetical protein